MAAIDDKWKEMLPTDSELSESMHEGVVMCDDNELEALSSFSERQDELVLYEMKRQSKPFSGWINKVQCVNYICFYIDNS
jgi:dsDNA-binding SOS-regulon protein